MLPDFAPTPHSLIPMFCPHFRTVYEVLSGFSLFTFCLLNFALSQRFNDNSNGRKKKRGSNRKRNPNNNGKIECFVPKITEAFKSISLCDGIPIETQSMTFR